MGPTEPSVVIFDTLYQSDPINLQPIFSLLIQNKMFEYAKPINKLKLFYNKQFSFRLLNDKNLADQLYGCIHQRYKEVDLLLIQQSAVQIRE